MRFCHFPLSPFFLGCVATAFVPFQQKLALVPRYYAPPSTSEQLCLDQRNRRVLLPLYSSIFDDINRLNNGDEMDPMSKEDLKLLRDVLAKIEETRAEDLVDLILREVSEKVMPDPMALARSKEVGGATAGMTAADASLASAVAKPADAFNCTHLEVQGKTTFRAIRDFLEFLDDTVDKNGQILKYATYPTHAEFPEVSLADMMKMMDGNPPVEYFFSAKKFFRIIMRLLKVEAGLAFTDKHVVKAASAQLKYRAVFTNAKSGPLDLVPLPEHTFNHWEEDKEFSRQFLDGVNPLMIRVVKDLKNDLSIELLDFFNDKVAADLELLANDKRLLFVSYDDLTHLKVNPHQAFPKAYNPDHSQDQPRYFAAPIVVFQLTKDLQELQVLAIQLDRTTGAEVYSPNTTDQHT